MVLCRTKQAGVVDGAGNDVPVGQTVELDDSVINVRALAEAGFVELVKETPKPTEKAKPKADE